MHKLHYFIIKRHRLRLRVTSLPVVRFANPSKLGAKRQRLCLRVASLPSVRFANPSELGAKRQRLCLRVASLPAVRFANPSELGAKRHGTGTRRYVRIFRAMPNQLEFCLLICTSINNCLCNRCCIKCRFINIGFFIRSFACFKLLDNLLNTRAMQWIAFYIVVNFTCQSIS